MSENIEQTNNTHTTIDITGIQLFSKVEYYKDLYENLLDKINLFLSTTFSTQEEKDVFKKISDQYIITIQKYIKWNEIWMFFTLSQQVNVLDSNISLFNALENKKIFENYYNIWNNTLTNKEDKRNIFEKLTIEPSIDSGFNQKRAIYSMLSAYEEAIAEAKTRKFTINIEKEYLEL